MPKSKILIADDNLTNVELLEAYLDGVDCEIAVAIDGRDTLAKVAEFQPDLILLDIMMPKLSGFEVCKTLKRDPNTRQIMILMVTALNEQGDIERAVAAGCDDFLSKPVNKLELVKRVEIMLKLRHVTDELRSPAPLHRQHGRAAARALTLSPVEGADIRFFAGALIGYGSLASFVSLVSLISTISTSTRKSASSLFSRRCRRRRWCG